MGPKKQPQCREEGLRAWREAARLVYHARHLSSQAGSPLAPDGPGSEIKDEVLPEAGEPVVEKRVNSCFVGTNLEERLRQDGIEAMTILGLTTDHCVSTTARMAANLGFEIHVVADACATFDRRRPDGTLYAAQRVHEISLASLHGKFATVVGSAEVLASLRRVITDSSLR